MKCLLLSLKHDIKHHFHLYMHSPTLSLVSLLANTINFFTNNTKTSSRTTPKLFITREAGKIVIISSRYSETRFSPKISRLPRALPEEISRLEGKFEVLNSGTKLLIPYIYCTNIWRHIFIWTEVIVVWKINIINIFNTIMCNF